MQNLETLKTLAESLPEDVRQNALDILEEMSTVVEGVGDEPVTWKPPYLRLVQGTTDRGSIPKGTAIGDFILGETKMEQPLKFIPIRIWDARQYWDPDQTNNKMLCWSPDAKRGHASPDTTCRNCEHGKWREEGGSDCGKTKQILAISADLRHVFTVTFSKSGYKVGMELEGLMKKAAVSPYQRTYGLKSETHATAKAVEVFKIEVLDEKQRKTADALLPFLKELFRIVSEDRKAMLDAFYEGLQAQVAQRALAAPAETPALTDGTQTTESADGATTTEVAAPVEATTSSLAKKYSV